MISKQIVKWGAAAALAVGTIPALALAKSHVSLPTNNITVTPTTAMAMEAPATKTSSRVTHAKVSKASHKKHRSSKHRRSTAVRHKSKTSARHVRKASSRKSHKSAAKTIRVG